jgi:hypothetical protein
MLKPTLEHRPEKPEVIIEIRDGIIDVTKGEGEVDIEIRDYDQILNKYLHHQGQTVKDRNGEEYIQKLYQGRGGNNEC